MHHTRAFEFDLSSLEAMIYLERGRKKFTEIIDETEKNARRQFRTGHKLIITAIAKLFCRVKLKNIEKRCKVVIIISTTVS